MIEWMHALPSEFDYPPIPPWRQSSEREYITAEGRTLIATDGGTDFPADRRRIRHCGIGIYGGGNSSWQYTSPLRGPVQINDKAELIAVVLAAEALQEQVELFPQGIEFIIDNQFVCFACQALATGGTLRTSTAHYPTFRRLQRVIRDIGVRDFFAFRWVPSHTKEGDGHDEELISADDRHLNEGADALASRGKELNRPPQSLIDGVRLRVKLTEALQTMLVTIHIQRKHLEEKRVAGLKQSCSVIKAGNVRPPPLLSLEEVRLKIPSYAYSSGSIFSKVSFNRAFDQVVFDLRSKRNSRPLEAMPWYWKQLQWPSIPSPSNRGATWLELYLDFAAATGIRTVGVSHSSRSTLKLSKDAFSSLTSFLEARSGVSPFKGKRANVTSLGPFGCRHGLAGVSIAPRFLCLEVWLPFLRWISSCLLSSPLLSCSGGVFPPLPVPLGLPPSGSLGPPLGGSLLAACPCFLRVPAVSWASALCIFCFTLANDFKILIFPP